MDTRVQARRDREREIVAATRTLFDERGMQDAAIDGIARMVGINKALIYRHFASKEELYVATMVDYLSELEGLMADVSGASALARLSESWTRFIDFCLAHPAFLDCGLSLMRRPAAELAGSVSESVWLRLGQGMGALLGPLARLLADGVRAGEFELDDPEYMASQLYSQTIGALHLARVGVGVRQGAGGLPEMFEIGREQVRRGCLAATLASVRRP
ncbi:MAG: hypothetical protein NVS1B9_12850 [Solirubrobacteraceae bacterium]